jgi:hypothetical protein
MTVTLTDKCWVCGHESLLLEEHHVVAQRHMGTHGRTILLCNNCHSACDAQSVVMKSKNKNTRAKNYIPVEHYARAIQVVNMLVAGELRYNLQKTEYEDVAVQTLMIPVSPRQLQRLHTLKQYYRYDNLQDFLIALVSNITKVQAIPKDSKR